MIRSCRILVLRHDVCGIRPDVCDLADLVYMEPQGSDPDTVLDCCSAFPR